MTMDDKKKYDSLLDAMSDDSDIQGKMDEFASTRQRNLRIEKARRASQQFQQAYYHEDSEEEQASEGNSETGEAEIPSFAQNMNKQPEDETPEINLTEPAEEDHDEQGGTKVIGLTRRFDAADAAAEPEVDKTKTVVMSNDEIQNLLEQDDEPLLRREYISRDEELEDLDEDDEDEEEYVYEKPHGNRSKSSHGKSRPEPESSKSRTKTVIVVLSCLLAAVLIGCAAIFIPQMFNSGDQTVEKDDEKLEQKLMKWIEDAGTDQDQLLKSVQDYEKDYNNLSDEGKRKINELLMNVTGKTFNELLAAAKNQKDDSSNNNTEIAEMKAKLKNQIASLDAQISDVSSRLDDARNQISQAYTTYTNDSTNVQNLQANVNSANSNVSRLNQQKSDLEAQIRTDKNTLDSVNAQIESLNDLEEPSDDDKRQLANLMAQKSDLENSIASNQSALDALPDQIKQALDEANNLNGQLQQAQNQLNNSAAAYDNVKNSDKDLESQLSDLQSQRDALASQLDSIE